MATTVLGLYETPAQADEVVVDLRANGFDADQISRVSPAGNDTVNERAAEGGGRGPLDIGTGFAADRLDDRLRDYGAPDHLARHYAEGVRRGGEFVAARVADARMDEAVTIFDRHDPIDVEGRAKAWRREGWAAPEPTAPPPTAQQRGEESIPVTEEELQVGKRQVRGGGVRVHTYVVEEPVREDVRLREEHVDVERRPADRPVRSGEEAFQERTIEASETREEPIVRKEARVIEEVVIDKDVTERTEEVSDTVRRTEVDVERTGEGRAGPTAGPTPEADEAYRRHFEQTLANQGYAFDDSRPAYRYGERLAQSDRFSGRDWSQIEPEARRLFEERNPGKWEQFEPAVHEGYNHARGQSR